MKSATINKLGFLVVIMMIVFVSGCSGGGVFAGKGTGAITAKLVWGSKTTAKTVSLAPAGVVTIRAIVSGPGMSDIVRDFPAASGSGRIDGIPSGTGLAFSLQALDLNGLVTYMGEVNKITIQIGQITDAGTIYMQLLDNAIISTDGSINGTITGLSDGDKATIILGNDSYLQSTVTAANGTFSFSNVPDGKYFLKVDVSGYTTSGSRDVVVTRKTASKTVAKRVAKSADFAVVKSDSSTFTYHWEQDVSRSGYQQSAYINTKPQITFLNQPLEVIDLAAAEKLQHDYNIILSNDSTSWNQEYAYRLLETLKSIPQTLRNSYNTQTLLPSKWVLTDSYLADDISIQKSSSGNVVTISTAAFVYAAPRMVLLNGLKGTFFSKKLHHALVQYVTNYGQDITAVEKILNDRYGCTTVIPNYTSLTASTTKEDSGRFQSFHANELVELINMFEEMPAGYRVVNGLKYLVRRKDGMPHPLYIEAPAVSWPTAQTASYIEFMDSAFIANADDMHRLILHEKSHFMWANLFSQTIKNDWIAVGGWYVNPNDPNGWSTTKMTEFVTAYAHKKNPDEDMAESIAYFVLNPDMLRSRSIVKYEFVRDRIMHGDLYISQIRSDLTFEVLNLFPDYNYPGKIKRVDIRVDGLPQDDKTVTVEIELNIINKVFDGAQNAYARVLSDLGTYKDFYMYPVNGDGSILRGTFSISKYSKSGLWVTDQIVVTDQVGNQRFEGVNDFGWKLFVNNTLDDTIKPKYVAQTLALQLSSPEMQSGHEVQKLTVTWKVDENQQMRTNSPVYALVTNPDSSAYRIEDYGTYDPVTKTGQIVFNITEYFAPGNYGVPYIMMYDQAENMGDQRFSASPNDEALKSVYINPKNPDVIPPEIDLNRITITGTPVNPASPDGETLVTIVYYARDDKSGLGMVTYRLLDPQGISHVQYHYHDNFYTLFFNGDPTAWKRYEISVVLPKGSPPGTWGLQEMEVYDKARNRKSYSFVETLHFELLTK
jgi:hypothetical protein